MGIRGTFDNERQPVPAGKYYWNVSLYGNYFESSNQRNPSVSGAAVHIYNNYYHAWGSYTVGSRYDEATGPNNKTFFEANLLEAGARTSPFFDSPTLYYADNFDIGKATGVSQKSNVGGTLEKFIAYRDRWINAPVTVIRGPSLPLSSFQNAGWRLENF